MTMKLSALAMAVLCIACSSASVAQSPQLEARSYIHNMRVIAQHFAGESRHAKIQMMASGERRFLVQGGTITEVTDALKPVDITKGVASNSFQVQVAYHRASNRWVLMAPQQSWSLNQQGLRGVEFYDITRPSEPKLISRWSVDGGDPGRALQMGSGPHRSYYDGGRYAYLTTAPNNDYYRGPGATNRDPNHEHPWETYRWGVQIIDVSNLEKPSLVSFWHVPGQKIDELELRDRWRFAGDYSAFDSLHGPVYTPRKIEDGGTLGIGAWGAFGMITLDLSDIKAPRVLSTWQTDKYVPGPGIPVHTVDITRLDRGFVITNPEPIQPQCKETWHQSYVIDMSNPREPRTLATLPVPQPPADAPYRSFCERYGRFGTHNPPHLKAPGKPHPNFTCYAYFNAGLQCYDITDPRRPKIVSYFIPGQGKETDQAQRYPSAMGEHIRTVDNVFIEWDRKLIWTATDSGLYLLSAPMLGEPELTAKPVTQWSQPALNAGHP